MRTSARALTLLLAVAGLSACAYSNDYGYGYGPTYPAYGTARYGDYRYDGADYYPGSWNGNAAPISGAGAQMLDPWLAQTTEGRTIVSTHIDLDHDGHITSGAAQRANVWFRRYADSDGDMRLTDPEIRMALVQGSLSRPGSFRRID